MASIRRGGGISLRSTPVTMTPRSGLDNVLGFLGQVASAGAALRGLADRRNNEKIASEVAQSNSKVVSYDDQLQGLRLKFANDYSGFQKASQPIRDQLAAWAEQNISTEEGKAHFAMKEEALFNRAQDPILSANSAAAAEQRERDAQSAAVKFLPRSVGEYGEIFAGTDKVQKQHASLEVANALREMGNVDGALAQQYGPVAAAAQQAKLLKRVDRATAMGIIAANHDKDLPRLYAQWKADGFAKGDGSFYGETFTEREREDIWSDAMRQRRLKDEFLSRQEAAADGRREEQAGQLYLEAVKQGRAQGQIDEGLMSALEAADPDKAARLHTTDWSRTALTRGETEAATAARARVAGTVSLLDPSDPVSLSVIETMKSEIGQDEALHFSTRDELLGELGEAAANVLGFSDLPPDVQAEQKGLSALRKLVRSPTGDLINPNQNPMVFAEIEGEYLEMVRSDSFDNGAAIKLASAAITIPDADVAGAVMRAFRDPVTRQELREAPGKALSIFPGVAPEDVFQVNASGQLDYGATMLEMQARGWDAAEEVGEDGEDNPLVRRALGGTNQSMYETTLSVLEMLKATNTLDVHIDHKDRLAQHNAKTELDAVRAIEDDRQVRRNDPASRARRLR